MVRVGFDLVEVARVRDLVERRGQRALERLFTPQEIDHCWRAPPPLRWQRLATRWAAKEAFIKAQGRPIPWREMEVVLEGRAPFLSWRGQKFPLSLSHTPDLAGAVVLLPEGVPPTAR
jgi:holo-[acyl-carrier protein] synthase